MKFLLFFLLFSGCAGLPLPTQNTTSVAGGALGGVALKETVDKVKKVFTPEYLLQVYPTEICSITSHDHVTCYLVPCALGEGECTAVYERADWEQQNPKVITLRSSAIVPIKKFCERNITACENYVQKYEGTTIVVVDDKK